MNNPRDPGAPSRPVRREVVLLCGFLLCVAIAVAALVVPELYDADPAAEPAKKASAAAAPPQDAAR